MAYEIIWSPEAEKDFQNILLYLKENWSLQSAEKFTANTFKKLEKLTLMPSLGRPTSKAIIYIYKLDKKNALFFSMENNHLILLSIFPYKKNITRSKYY